MTAHERGPTTGSTRSPARDTGREHHAPPATASADQEPPQPSWPSSPAHGEPHQPSADTAQDAGGTQPSAQRHVTAAPREPRAHRGIAADDPDASADPADSGPAARWPAPGPAIAERASPAGQHARHEATARHEPEGRQHSGAVAEAEPGAASPERPAAAAATGATRSSARPASRGSPARPGRTTPPSTGRRRRTRLAPESSLADDAAAPGQRGRAAVRGGLVGRRSEAVRGFPHPAAGPPGRAAAAASPPRYDAETEPASPVRARAGHAAGIRR